MAAPNKQGLDYYPLSVDLLDDPKLRRPKMQFGYLAPVVYISLLGQLYRDKGYYIDYRDPDTVIWQVLCDLQGKYQPSQETVAGVITALVACGLFSGDHFQRGFITSRTAQSVYYRATVTRKTVDIDDSLWLLSLAEMKSVSAKHCYYLKRYNEANNGVNCLNNGVNQPIYKQSKVNSSSCSSNNDTENLKASEGVVTQEVVERADALLASSEQQSAEYREKYGDSIAGFEVIKGAACSAYERERIIGFADKYGSWWVEEALKVAGDNGADNILSYLDKVLQNWQNDGKETWESKSQGSKKAQGSKGVRKQKKNSEYADSNYAGEVDYGKYF